MWATISYHFSCSGLSASCFKISFSLAPRPKNSSRPGTGLSPAKLFEPGPVSMSVHIMDSQCVAQICHRSLCQATPSPGAAFQANKNLRESSSRTSWHKSQAIESKARRQHFAKISSAAHEVHWYTNVGSHRSWIGLGSFLGYISSKNRLYAYLCAAHRYQQPGNAINSRMRKEHPPSCTHELRKVAPPRLLRYSGGD